MAAVVKTKKILGLLWTRGSPLPFVSSSEGDEGIFLSRLRDALDPRTETEDSALSALYFRLVNRRGAKSKLLTFEGDFAKEPWTTLPGRVNHSRS